MEIAIIPRSIICKFFHNDRNQIHANILITSILIISVLILWENHNGHLSSIPHFCIFQKIMNIPCLGCGVTRSLFAITEGNIVFAWKSNPGGLFLFLYFITQIPLRIFAIKFYDAGNQISKISRFGSTIVICILFLVWMIKLIP